MFSHFFKAIWTEAYQQNDSNIISLLEANPRAIALDVGCGDGQKTIEFKNKIGCSEIMGIDGVIDRLKSARKRGVNVVKQVKLENRWPFIDSYFDVIISNQVIEHIPDIDNFIQEIKRVLKPGGYAIISTENLASWHNIFALLIGFQDFSHHLIKKTHVGNPLSPHFGEKTVSWSGPGNSGSDDTAYPHIKIFTYKSLIRVFEEFGFKYESGLGSGYYPLFGFPGQLASRVDPTHSHFITIKMRN